jgi:uncharacterized protein
VKRAKPARRSPAPARSAETATAMPQDELDRWLQAKTLPRPLARNLSMLDGFVSAIVAGPVSMDPRDWICPLLAIEPDAFDHGATPEYAAISAVILRHNAIGDTLATQPDRFQPIFAKRPNGEVDPGSWAMGFYAAMKLNLMAWSKILAKGAPEFLHLLPIWAYCTDEAGHSLLRPLIGDDPIAQAMLPGLWRDIPNSVERLRQYWMPTRFQTSHSKSP